MWMKEKRGKQYLATVLVISMLCQLIGGNLIFPDTAWAAGQSAPRKVVRVTEEEIRDALEEYDGSFYIDEENIPFDEIHRKDARELIKETLKDTVLVRQETLGDQCAAFVAVVPADEDEAAEIATDSDASEELTTEALVDSVFMIGLNGSSRPCEFVLEIETDGGIIAERMLVSEYTGLGGGPGIATPSNKATASDTATPSQSGQKATPSVTDGAAKATASNETETVGADDDTETDEEELLEDEVELILDATASNTEEIFWDNLEEETDYATFEEGELQVIERDELGGLVKENERAKGIRAMLASMFSDEEKENEGEAEEAPAFALAAESILVMEVRTDASDITGLPMYFVNMYHPAIISSFFDGMNMEQEYTRVIASFFTENGKADTERDIVMSDYDDGIYRVAIPESENPDDPYVKVTFTVEYEEDDKPVSANVGMQYRFTGAPGVQDDGSYVFAYEPITSDAFFYSGRENPDQTMTSYWGAHPTSNPSSLSNSYLFFDLQKVLNDVLIQAGGSGHVKPTRLWIYYKDGDAEERTGQLRTQMLKDTVYRFQFPFEIEANENTQLVLYEADEDGKLIKDEGGGWPHAFPFMYSSENDYNMLKVYRLLGENAEEDESDSIWGTYEPDHTPGKSRYIMYDNAFTKYDVDASDPNDPDKVLTNSIYAVVWGAGEDQELSREALEGQFQNLTDSDVQIARLEPSKETDFVEGTWRKLQTTLGAEVETLAVWGNDIHVRYFHYVNQSGAAPTLVDLQKQVEDAITKQEPLTYSEKAYEFSDILTIDNTYDYPCFYAAKGHNNMPTHGKWDSVLSVNTMGDESQSIPWGEMTTDPNIYYGTATLYDYYSDYELTGHNRGTFVYKENEEGNGAFVENPDHVTQAMENDVLGINDSGDAAYSAQGLSFNIAVADYFASETTVPRNQLKPLYFSYMHRYIGAFSGQEKAQMVERLPGYDDKNINDYNKPDSEMAGIKQGIMAKTLDSNGDLLFQVNDETTCAAPYFSERFVRGENSLNAAVGMVYNDISFPFTRDKNGYWSYDSSKREDGVLLKRDKESGAYYMERNSDGDNAVLVHHNAKNPLYEFMPLDSNNKKTIVTGVNAYQQGGDHVGRAYANYMMGMRLDIPFTLPEGGDGKIENMNENGEITRQDAIFRFSGDDDVWVYVDGQLALDLGGIHDFGLCEINFGSKKVTYRAGIQNDIWKKKAGITGYTSNAYEQLTIKRGDEFISPMDSTDDRDWRYNHTKDWNWKDLDLNLDDGEEHVISIFYMERGLYASNLKISFNFGSSNSFQVEHHLDEENVVKAVEQRKEYETSGSISDEMGMNPQFLEAIKYLGGFGFHLETAATRGKTKPVETSAGYLKPGGYKDYNLQDTPTAEDVAPFMAESDVRIASVNNEQKLIYIRSWGEADTNASQEVINRRLVNIYPKGKGVFSWDEKLPPQDGEGEPTDAEYLRLEIYNAGNQSSDNGSALYVGLLDVNGKQVGGWANTLTYEGYSNGLEAQNWSTVRISKEKLEAKAPDGFDWTQIQAVQVCYYDETEISVKNIQLRAKPFDQTLKIFTVSDDMISDYKSISEDGKTSFLSYAEGAWYNSSTGGETPSVSPVMVDENGDFYLGSEGYALFSDKFRLGSYISLEMNQLDPRVFESRWTLQENGAPIKESWLTDSNSGSSAIQKIEGIATSDQIGRKPYDGRQEELPELEVEGLQDPNKDTILYRSFNRPDNNKTGFHIGVRYDTEIDTASIVVKKELSEEAENDPDLKDKEYQFLIVYDDIGYMGLELHLENSFVYDAFTLKAGEAKKVDVVAGTRYWIYELDRPIEAVEEDLGGEITSRSQLTNYLSQELQAVTTGRAEKERDGSWSIILSRRTNHTDVKISTRGANGFAFTKDKFGKGETEDGIQGFVFKNGVEKKGNGEVLLLKWDITNEPQTALNGATFELYRLDKESGEYKSYGNRDYTTDELKKNAVNAFAEAAGADWSIPDNGPYSGFIVKDLLPGDYYFIETKAPIGYRLDATTQYKFTIEEGGKAVVQVDNKKLPPKYGRVVLTKKDAEDPTKLLSGAKFSLYRWPDGYEDQWNQRNQWGMNSEIWSGAMKAAQLIQENITTGQDGTLAVDGLDLDVKYVFVETKAPEGYLLAANPTPQPFIIQADETVNLEYALTVANESKNEAAIRVSKEVDGDGYAKYKDDPFIIRITQVHADGSVMQDGIQAEVVLKTGEESGWIYVTFPENSDDPSDEWAYFRIDETVPMEYICSGMELLSGNGEKAVFNPDTRILQVQVGVCAEVRVNNKEYHTPYFHYRSAVTNAASENAGWTFKEGTPWNSKTGEGDDAAAVFSSRFWWKRDSDEDEQPDETLKQE